jgi:aminotransferase
MKFRTEDIMPPPVLRLLREAAEYLGAPDFLNLGQGVPGHVPPKRALAMLEERMQHPSVHRYTPDQGLLELREELALFLRQNEGIDADPETELVITAGANQALTGAMLTLLEHGQNVVMPSPYYFNAVMSVHLCGGEVRTMPVDSEFQPSAEALRKSIDENTRAVLLISPNNPTGAVYRRDHINEILDACLEHELFLVFDESYARLVYDGAEHYSPRSRKDALDHVVSLGSLSKDFGMSGWRIGYIIGSSAFVDEFLKFQDSATICAPTAGQMLALEILKSSVDEIEYELKQQGLMRELAYLRVNEIDALQTVRTQGTFYLFPRVKGCKDSESLTSEILRTASMFVLPGSIFGEAGEGHIRMSIGPLTQEAVDESFDRLERFFEDY